MALLALLSAGKAVGANELTDAFDGFSGSGIKVARHLQKFGLATVQAVPGVAGRSAYRISLTTAGRRVAVALADIDKGFR